MFFVCALVVLRWRRDRAVLVAAIAALAAFILSLGPRLHVAGHLFHHAYLPGWVILHPPLIGDILPSRFGLAIDLALALLLSVFVDRHVLAGGRRSSRLLLGLAALVSLTTVVPSVLPVSRDTTPRYFLPEGAVTTLRQDVAVLVVPYYDGTSMLWQARSGYRLTVAEGLAVTAQGDGRAAFFALGPVTDAYTPIQTSGAEPSRDPTTRASILRQLRRAHTAEVVVGPMTHQADAVGFTTWLVGRRPTWTQGVYVWRL